MTLMKNFICGHLDRDNHHDIVSIFLFEQKMLAQKIYPAHNTFEMRASYGHVRLTRAWVGNLLMWSGISSATMLITK